MIFYKTILRLLELAKHRGRARCKIIRAFRHFKYILICRLENYLIYHADISRCKLISSKDENIVCSLTTYPGRIHECFLAIKSILLQSVPPNRIVLWLATAQFPDKILPKEYDIIKSLGVEIRFCDDLRSHKKYFYMLQEQKENELVITFDDDIIYHPDTIKRALDMHKQYPDCIVCNEAKIITVDKKNLLTPYVKWKTAPDGNKIPDIYKYSVLTGSGCLYPYGIMPRETFDEQAIRNNAFSADDLWITFIAKAYNIKIAPTTIMAKPYSTIRNSQKSHLAQINCLGTGNDDTIKIMLDIYPNLKDKLIKNLG